MYNNQISHRVHRNAFESLALKNSNNSIEHSEHSGLTIERKYTYRGGEHVDVDDLFMSKSCQIQYLLRTNIGIAEITDNFLDKSTNSNNYIAWFLLSLVVLLTRF